MKISYNEACSLHCSSLEQDLMLCEAAGFDAIEIRLDQLAAYLGHHSLQELKLYFSSHRIQPQMLNAVYLYDDFLSANDDPARAQALTEQYLFAVLAARELGIPGIIIVPPIWKEHPHDLPEAVTKEICVRILTQLGKLAAPYGIRLCFETVGLTRSAVRTVAFAEEIIEAVGLDNVGHVLDSYNIFLETRDPQFDFLRTLDPARIFAVHINNGDGVTLTTQAERCFPDHGPLDLDNYLRVLRGHGYDGIVSVEVFRPAYWEQRADWVVRQAYETTAEVMRRNGCLE